MIDFHTHVLPGIDDGSANLDMTKMMLLAERSQDVKQVAATPHFYANRISVKQFLKNREDAYAAVKAMSAGMNTGALPSLSLGAEVYYFPGIGEANQLESLAIGDTRTILIELPFEPWSDSVFEDIRKIIEAQHLLVVLAHIERYYELQRNKDIWNRILALPVIPQINYGSFLRPKSGLFRKDRHKQFCLDFLRRHPRTILGSDCHNLTTRRPNVKEGRNVIEAELGKDALDCVDKVTYEVLS